MYKARLVSGCSMAIALPDSPGRWSCPRGFQREEGKCPGRLGRPVTALGFFDTFVTSSYKALTRSVAPLAEPVKPIGLFRSRRP